MMLATPNYGSLRRCSRCAAPIHRVRRIAQLDHLHDAETHAQHVFADFSPVSISCCPPPSDSIPWICTTSVSGHATSVPRHALLQQALGIRKRFADADERSTLIAGVDQPTITGHARARWWFLYRITNAGDDTVPTEFALIEEIDAYFVRDEHSELPHNSAVVAAGAGPARARTHRQAATRTSGSRRRTLVLTEREFRAGDSSKHDWRRMSLVERRGLLAGVVFPMPG